MLIGMGTVFVFLTLLVFATKAMSALAQRLQPAGVVPPHKQEQQQDEQRRRDCPAPQPLSHRV